MFTASMTFALGDEVESVQDSVRRWAQERLAPQAARIDRDNCFSRAIWEEMGSLGLLGITVDEEFGGSGMGYLAHAVATEEIARVSASVSLSYAAHSNLCANQIRLNGTKGAETSIPSKALLGRACRCFGHVGSFCGLRCRIDATQEPKKGTGTTG